MNCSWLIFIIITYIIIIYLIISYNLFLYFFFVYISFLDLVNSDTGFLTRIFCELHYIKNSNIWKIAIAQ